MTVSKHPDATRLLVLRLPRLVRPTLHHPPQ